MKTDLYTKAVLTMIALFLGVLASDKVYDVVVPEVQAADADALPPMREVWSCMDMTEWKTNLRTNPELANVKPPYAWMTLLNSLGYDHFVFPEKNIMCGRV